MNLGVHGEKLRKIIPGLKPRYGIKVSIYEQRGENSYVYKEDVGARIGISDDDTEKYHLLHNRVDTPPVSYDYVGQTANGDSHVAFVRTGQKSFYPIKPPIGMKDSEGNDINAFTAADTAMREWFVNEAKGMINYFDEGEDNWWHTDQAKWVFIGFAALLLLAGGAYYVTSTNEAIVESLKAAKSIAPLALIRLRR